MKGSISHELDVDLPAGEVWAVVGSLRHYQLVAELLPQYIEKVEVERGDGGVNTILKVHHGVKGKHGRQTQRDKYVKVDHKQRIKELVVIEGGYLTFGFQSCLARFEVIEKSGGTSTIRTTMEYEVNNDDAEKVYLANIDLLVDGAKAISQYLIKNKSVINKK